MRRETLIGLLSLYSPEQQQNEDNDQDDSQRAGREISPASAVRPRRQHADQHEQQDDDQDRSELMIFSRLVRANVKLYLRPPNRVRRPLPTAAIPDRTHPEATMARSRQSRRKGLNRDFPDRILPRAENASRPGYRGPSGLWLGHCMAIFWWFDRIERARFGIPCCAVACESGGCAIESRLPSPPPIVSDCTRSSRTPRARRSTSGGRG